ncbi:MAG: hypothetical protein KGL46_03895 [Hyphomicrobiales bacterium]|nr:hypothetical protein [Hyphomicrobiales bacterium]
MTDFFTTVCEHCGQDVARALIDNFGGMRLYVPMQWSADHALNTMGEAAARKLIEHFSGEKIDVPRFLGFRAAGRRRARLVRRLAKQGLTKNEIARQADCTARWVSKIVADEDSPKDPRQGDLF